MGPNFESEPFDPLADLVSDFERRHGLSLGTGAAQYVMAIFATAEMRQLANGWRETDELKEDISVKPIVISEADHGDVITLKITGRLVCGDDSVGVLRRAVDRAVDPRRRAVIIDLAGVNACDCAGIGQGLAYSLTQAHSAGVCIFFINRRPYIEKLLIMYKLDTILCGFVPFSVRFEMRYGPTGGFENKKLGKRFYETFLPSIKAEIITDVFALRDALMTDETFTLEEKQKLMQDLVLVF